MFVTPGSRAGRGAAVSTLYVQARPVRLAYAATVMVDLRNGRAQNFWVDPLTGNVILNFKNGKPGQSGFIELTQDATGSRLLSGYTSSPMSVILPGGTAITLTTTANAKDRLFYLVDHLGFVNLTSSLAYA